VEKKAKLSYEYLKYKTFARLKLDKLTKEDLDKMSNEIDILKSGVRHHYPVFGGMYESSERYEARLKMEEEQRENDRVEAKVLEVKLDKKKLLREKLLNDFIIKTEYDFTLEEANIIFE